MCVLPRQSSHALPKCYRHLMSSSSSPIIDFYPVSFKLDVNGQAYAWMGVNLLPFIEIHRLQKAMQQVEMLQHEEIERNTLSSTPHVYFKL